MMWRKLQSRGVDLGIDGVLMCPGSSSSGARLNDVWNQRRYEGKLTLDIGQVGV